MSPGVRSRSERIREAALLSGVGGFLDAYMFLAHGGVFANAQTGNIVLFGVDLAGHRWSDAIRHLVPVLAFVLGMATVQLLTLSDVRRRLHRPTRVVLGVEAAVLALVGVLPDHTPDLLVIGLVAWAATLQVGTFRTVGEVAYNTTFTTGNLRALVEAAFDWRWRGNRASRVPTRALAAVIGAFALGALVGGLLTRLWHTHAVLVALVPLGLALVLFVSDTRRRERAADAG